MENFEALNTTLQIIFGLVAFIVMIFVAVLGYVVKQQNKIFEVISENKKDCQKSIKENSNKDEEVREKLEQKIEKRYVSNERLLVVENKLENSIRLLNSNIKTLTIAIEKIND